ncbi:MAG: replicative DNA helicase [Oscillospiraceae bacterium]|nr:replicative DNA helicase [Oscillospiraceae bacterium]MBQ6846195.1 replicative DNA helicase [Oscillospiraceae bacterium]MBQ7119195.1 replicative DNA helicase [Oscillospiraceae bacterium]
MDELIGARLPHNVEAEQSVLGSMLLDERCVPEVMEHLRSEDFYVSQNRAIFEAMQSMFTLNETIDPVTVIDKLTVRGTLDAAGGRTYILKLLDVTPTAVNVAQYIKIVRDRAVLRNLDEITAEIHEVIASGEGEADAVVEFAEQKIYEIRNEKKAKGMAPIRDVLENTYAHLGHLAKNAGKLPGVSTGFSTVDAFLSGLNDSDFIILAANTGVGKTSFALNICSNAAKSCGKAVVVFSLEMSNEQLALRLIAGDALIDSKKLRTGILNEEEWVAIAHASENLANTKIYLADATGVTVNEMKAKCRRLNEEIGLVIVDYLQLVQSGIKSDSRANEVAAISRALKIMAKDLNVPILCLSQLSRSSDKQERRPRLSDLRESGAIEQDADVVMILYRENPETPETVKLLIEKNRHGSTGDIDLHWDGKYTKFTSIDTHGY